ncbi:hypothetical protein CDPG_00074 [Cellulophaga phage phi47:1]|nr:hypothetical protein CDPG_00074 [Cellulophaga phage phi47:1]
MIKARSKPFFLELKGGGLSADLFFQNPIFKGEENSRRPDHNLRNRILKTQNSRRVSGAKSNLRLKSFVHSSAKRARSVLMSVKTANNRLAGAVFGLRHE